MVEVISSLVRSFSDTSDFGADLLTTDYVYTPYCTLQNTFRRHLGQVTIGLQVSVHSSTEYILDKYSVNK